MRASSKERNSAGENCQLVDGKHWVTILNLEAVLAPFPSPSTFKWLKAQILFNRETASTSENR
jgi:hypothetical protein